MFHHSFVISILEKKSYPAPLLENEKSLTPPYLVLTMHYIYIDIMEDLKTWRGEFHIYVWYMLAYISFRRGGGGVSDFSFSNKGAG